MGLLHQLSIPSVEINAKSFVDGFPLYGSSIAGFTDIEKSDVILVPDPSTFAILSDYFDTDHQDPAYISKSARMFAFVHKGYGGGQFHLDSRFIIQKAENFAKKSGFEKSYWAAELEFFIFDEILDQKNRSPIISKEAPWISSNTEDRINFKKDIIVILPPMP